MTRSQIVATGTLLVVAASAAQAQTLGSFSWQLQPFCNVVTVTVTQAGTVYTVDGFDDQCGGPQRAPLVGQATQNPDGSIGFGLSVVTVPGGRGVQIDARIAIATLSGSWSDSAGNSGTFVFNANTGGTPRPLPVASPIPSVFSLRADGGFLTQGTPGVGTIPAQGAGSRMMWHAGKAAFRAGDVSGTEWDDAGVGSRSVAFGSDTRASGSASTAMGNRSTASGPTSTAMGELTVASASASTAMGSRSTASGPTSTAMGELGVASGSVSTTMGSRTMASGLSSTAMGELTVASGSASTAMGSQSVAGGSASLAVGSRAQALGSGSIVLGTNVQATAAANGTFVFADGSGANTFVVSESNQFVARAAGGVTFYTSAGLASGLRLAASGSQWLGISDVNTKHAFRSFDGEQVLAKLAQMPVMEWSYLAQAPSIRHVGPTAQDFHAAFGLGEDPLRIGTMDADGVALAGVKALEARTRTLQSENDELRARLSALEQLLAKK